ncbi:phenylacetate--CoA ligase family protein [Streptomyces sp. NPDC015032]|uniref:phenylacetate--CoA ligase family protein n=1 Tax=Streptomyces sp. NPDC015032 TaxID=3364937 RepID=UPI0036F88310
MADAYWDAEFDTMPWDELRTWQRGQFAAFLTSLAKSSPFYAQRLDGVPLGQAGSTAVWAAVPFTTKDDLRAGQQAATTDALLGDLQGVDNGDIVQVVASSGTTGIPVFFGLTDADRRSWLDSVANMFFTAGVRRDSVVALTTGMPLVAGGMPYADAVRRIGATLVWVGGQTTARMATIMQKLKVDTLIGTASFATFFAGRCEEVLGVPADQLSVRTVIAGGEPGMGQEAMRERVRSGWGADRISEVMGLCDVMPGMWAECPEGRGMHFTAGRNVFVELIDPTTGEPVSWELDAHGEAVYTTFTRQATAVVRFRSRDHVRVVSTDCPCGRTSPLIRCVGRTDDMLIYKAMNVFPSAIRDVVVDGFAAEISGPLRLRKAHADQVRFDEAIPLEIELPEGRAPGSAGDLAARIETAVLEQLRVRVAIEFLRHGAIPLGEYKNALTYVRQ